VKGLIQALEEKDRGCVLEVQPVLRDLVVVERMQRLVEGVRKMVVEEAVHSLLQVRGQIAASLEFHWVPCICQKKKKKKKKKKLQH
jgi:hypothetical protein